MDSNNHQQPFEPTAFKEPVRYKLQTGVKIGIVGLIVNIIGFLLISFAVFSAMEGTVLTVATGIESELILSAAIGAVGAALDIFSVVSSRRRGGSAIPAGLGLAAAGCHLVIALLAIS